MDWKAAIVPACMRELGLWCMHECAARLGAEVWRDGGARPMWDAPVFREQSARYGTGHGKLHGFRSLQIVDAHLRYPSICS